MSPALASRTCLLACLLAACFAGPSNPKPAIEFTTVPPADAGGPDKLAPVAGRVRGAHPNQRVVLFARSGAWWVQPFRSRPFTAIERDLTWKNTIHLGTEYAALLVEPDYRPPVTTDSLPQSGGGVVAVTTIKGSGTWTPPAARTVTFSGYQWQIVQVPIDRHGHNDCDARNVWVDGDGHLHLLLAERDGRWTGAALILTRPLGYGTYMFTVRDTSHLDAAAALLMYTWDDRADEDHRELNISISKWGNPASKNAQFVLEREDVAQNVFRFSAPSGRLTHAFRWQPGHAVFTTVRGANDAPAGMPVAHQEFTAGVPAPLTTTVRLSFLYARESPTPPAGNVEVVVEKHSWPGNIRELQNLIERAVICSTGERLEVPVWDLDRDIVSPAAGKIEGSSQTLEEVDRAQILAALKATGGVLSGPQGAARRLGINRSTLQFRMKKLGIARRRSEYALARDSE